MSAQLGLAILVKQGNGASPTELFTSLLGLRSKTVTINRATVDVTNADSTDRWRELLAGAGVRSLSISGDGVFKDGAPSDELREDIMENDANRNYQVIIPGLGSFKGPFQITQLEYAGQHDGEATYKFSLESAGALVWTGA